MTEKAKSYSLKKPWRKTSLGVKMGLDHVSTALIDENVPTAEGEFQGNTAADIEAHMRRHPEIPRAVTLYTYTPTTFGRSRAHAEGGTLEAHTALVEQRAAELGAMGIDVRIERVTV